MHTLATRSHGIFCEKCLSKTTNTLVYISTRVSPIAFKIFLRVPRCLGTSTAVISRLRQNAGSGRFSQIRSHIYHNMTILHFHPMLSCTHYALWFVSVLQTDQPCGSQSWISCPHLHFLSTEIMLHVVREDRRQFRDSLCKIGENRAVGAGVAGPAAGLPKIGALTLKK